MEFHLDFSPQLLDLRPTDKHLTSIAGVGTLIEAFDQSKLKEPFIKCLPLRHTNRSQGSYRMGLILLASFLRGHDCLEDLDEFRRDPYMAELMRGETVAPRTMGDFLRDFEE